MMEIEKLKDMLRNAAGGPVGIQMCQEAADALEQLQAESDMLKEEVQQMRWIPVEERPQEEIGNYAYPPAHIDRDAWGPCDECKPSCMGCVKSYGWDRYGKAQACDTCEDYSNFEPDDNYCAYCGRPMTEEAWNMIERRLPYGETH